jgi:hypothetical protein
MGRHKITIEPGTPADIELLQKTREWSHLTPKQAAFVSDFLTTGDAAHAMTVAYPTTTVLSRRAFQWQVLRAQAIVEVLEIWKWRSPREALIAIVKEQQKAAPKGSVAAKDFTVQLERLLLGVKGSNKSHFQDPDAPALEPVPPVEKGSADKRIPEGAQVWYDNATGAALGYRFDGKDTQL